MSRKALKHFIYTHTPGIFFNRCTAAAVDEDDESDQSFHPRKQDEQPPLKSPSSGVPQLNCKHS